MAPATVIPSLPFFSLVSLGPAQPQPGLRLLAVRPVEHRHLALFLWPRGLPADRLDRLPLARPAGVASAPARSQFHRQAVAELDSLGRAQFDLAPSLSARLCQDLLVRRPASEAAYAVKAKMAAPGQEAFVRRLGRLPPLELYLE